MRRERDRERFRQAVLSAAREIAREDGWQAVTIRKVADRIEYSGAALYEYFANKDAILHALMCEGFRQITDVLHAAWDGTHFLPDVAQAYWQFAFANPDLYQVMHSLGGIPFGTTQTPPEAVSAFAALRSAVGGTLPDGGACVPDLDTRTEIFWAALHGMVSLAMSGRIKGGEARAMEIARHATEVLMAGWRQEAGV